MKTIFISFFSILLLLFSSCFNCRDYYTSFKEQELAVKIIKKYRDAENHSMQTIEYFDSKGKLIVDQVRTTPGLFESVEIGDSLIKEKGSLAYLVKKKDTTLVFYPVCKGDTMK